MGKGIRRKTIYATTIVAMIALVGGYALASTFAFTNTSSQNESGFAVTTAGTIWTFNTATATNEGTTTCTTTTTTSYALSGSHQVETINLNSSGTGTCVATDFAEVYNISALIPTTGSTDQFTFFAEMGGSSACTTTHAEVVALTVTTTATSTTMLYLHFAVDYGAVPQTLCSVDIAVSGT
jgi:hypothetical protein